VRNPLEARPAVSPYKLKSHVIKIILLLQLSSKYKPLRTSFQDECLQDARIITFNKLIS